MHQYSQGKNHTQGHKAIPAGKFEEEQGRKGFFGPVSHLIKNSAPTRWTNIEGPLKPHLYDLVPAEYETGRWYRLLFNSDLTIYSMWGQVTDLALQKNHTALRNADGETLYFCHQGAGVVLTEYGLLSFKVGSYIVIPKAVTHTIVFFEKTQFLIIEAKTSYYREPDRGMAGRNAFYDLASLGKPNLDSQNEFKKTYNFESKEIIVLKSGSTKFTYDQCIYDTDSWKGDYFPFTLHIDDLMPMISHRVHLPPSVHTTFVANGFVVCTFLPRPIESDEDALKVPFYHQNIDYDEVLFYHAGHFFSRDNLHSNMISLHPAGFPHGPHPKAFANQNKKIFTDEVAIMIDTTQTLEVDPYFENLEVKSYWQSWMKK